jgi:SAM-dependent methyltransferase
VPHDPLRQELQQVARRYARRASVLPADRYSLLRPEVWQMLHERQRAICQGLAARPWHPAALHLTEVGCGAGGNLLDFLRLGCRPEHLTGCELLPERLAQARELLPPAVRLEAGDASAVAIAPGSQDIVLQATVFSSLLDDAVQQRLADAMWHWLKPGGAVLWYDFTVNNPRNPDVRGVPLARVRQLFPQAVAWDARRLTLAPPLARRLCALHPSLYTVFNAVPWLRTHRLIWIQKAD